jgi:EmrB/QacA subfamily drug resistance transporter
MKPAPPVAASSLPAAPAAPPPAESAPHEYPPPGAVRGIIAGIMLAMFLSALEQTIIAPALPTIGVRLNDIENLSWVVTAYLLAATTVTPLFGKLSDIYGRRRILLTGVSIFIVGSVACALAPTLWALVAARALQGIGGGGILPIAQAIIADMVPPRERPRYQTQSAVMFTAASVIGPLLGGILTDHLHWSLIFWINLPLGALALVMSNRALKRLPRNERPHRLDFAGATLMVTAALTLMLAMTWGGVRYPWMSSEILGLLAGSAILWMLFAWRLVTAAEPFIPLDVMRQPVVAACVAAGFFSIGAIIGLSIYLPLYLELMLGATPSMSGTALIALTVGSVLGAMVAGRSLARYRHYKRLPMAGLAIAVLILAFMAYARDSLSIPTVSALLFVGGGGIGTHRAFRPAAAARIRRRFLGGVRVGVRGRRGVHRRRAPRARPDRGTPAARPRAVGGSNTRSAAARGRVVRARASRPSWPRSRRSRRGSARAASRR